MLRGRIVQTSKCFMGVSIAVALSPFAQGQTWTQRFPSTSPPARFEHAMALDTARSQVVLFGGGSSGAQFGDTWVWDGTTWAQKLPALSPPARLEHATAYDAAHGQTVLFGGFGASGLLGDAWTWDGTNWTPASPSSAPSPRTFHAMDFDARRNQAVLFGGQEGSPNFAILGDTWTWDGTNWTMQSPSASPSARREHRMA